MRHITLYNGCKEDHKNNIHDFLGDFNSLIKSFQSHGYDHKYPIVVNQSGYLMNGAHRLACCMYFGIPPIVVTQKSDFNVNWDLEWFKKNQFSQDDIINLLYEYNKYKALDLVILWPGYENQVKKLYSSLEENNLNILGNIKINFSRHSFLEVINDIYSLDNKDIKHSIYDKGLSLLKKGTNIKVILIEKKEIPQKAELKKEIRNKIRKGTDSIYETFHWGDHKEEEEFLKNIFLSSNNVSHIKMRNEIIPKDFFKKLSELNSFLQKEHISPEDICIVGSGGLGIYNIFQVTDIDIIQKEHNDTGVIKKGLIDILDYQYYEKLTNQEMIENHNYHFIFRGLKFINLSILQDVKGLQGNRSKDLKQAKKIQDFLQKNIKCNGSYQDIIFEIYYVKNLLRVYFFKFAIFLTKKLGIYETSSYLWRKYVLKNLK